MKKTLNLIFKIFLAFLLIICSISLFITTYFAADIEKTVVMKIKEALDAPLILEKVDFSIYNKFPYASVKITNLLVKESNGFSNDTLLFTKQAYVEISLIDMLKKKYNVHSIIITNAKINIKYNKFKDPNFLIFKKTPGKKQPLTFKKITLINTKLNITKINPKLNIDWVLKRSIISLDNDNFKFNVDGFSNSMTVGITDYMSSKKFSVIANSEIKKDTITILSSDIDIKDVKLNVKGTVLHGNSVNLEIRGENQEINQIITILPDKIKTKCNAFTTDGKINFNSVLKGLINKENNPLFKMKYNIYNADFRLKSITFSLQNIQMKGEVTNGKDKSFSSTIITSEIFNAKTENGNIEGSFILSDLNKYFLNSKFKSSWELQQVNQYFKKSPFIKLKGRLIGNTTYKGYIAFNPKFKKMFLNAQHKSNIKFEKVSFYHKISPHKFNFKFIECKINNNNIIVNSCNSTISETDIDFNGKIVNLIEYLLKESPKIYIDGKLKSTYTNFYELLDLKEKKYDNNKNYTSKILPNWIAANAIIDIKQFSYKKFVASDLTGIIKYNNSEIKATDLNARSLNGIIFGGFSLTEPIRNNLKLTSNINLKKINIRNSFDAFNNYGQNIIVKEQLKGVGSAEIKIESHWKPNFVLDKNKLKINSHLVIEKGELIDFKPLENLSSYVSLDELKHVKFSTLENSIDIANEIITIPTMEIKSSALSVFLSGTHSFNQEINYEVTLLLSELLSSSFRKKNTKITQFGEQQQDGKIFNTVYFKMDGTTKDPKISLNKIRFMEDINDSFKKEKLIIKNIIDEDILQNKEKTNKEKGQEIEIEWNP